MSEPRDDTTEPRERDSTPPPPGSEHDTPTGREHAPGSYYYDDATGYEIYDPSEDDEDDADEAGDEDAAGKPSEQ
ncbi:MAG TPA: hypothetical protein VF656_09485 [Pyrinomonadaceae bacterium]|jgi:hypothetical protein